LTLSNGLLNPNLESSKVLQSLEKGFSQRFKTKTKLIKEHFKDFGQFKLWVLPAQEYDVLVLEGLTLSIQKSENKKYEALRLLSELSRILECFKTNCFVLLLQRLPNIQEVRVGTETSLELRVCIKGNLRFVNPEKPNVSKQKCAETYWVTM